MKLKITFATLLLLAGTVTFAQPRWPAKLRAKSENEWMKDNLHLSEGQLTRASSIVNEFEAQMDHAAETPETRVKAQARLMRKKDIDMKAVLSGSQYQKWYANEVQSRQRHNATYKEGRGPM